MEDYNFNQQKPDLIDEKQNNGLSLTIFSMTLFVLFFIVIIDNDISFVMSILIVLIIHELGHFIAMKLFKYKNVKMLFIPLMGAFVKGSRKKYSQKQSFIVAISGPFPGIVIGIILMLYGSQIQSSILLDLGMLFLILNIINILPLDPLDGGQMFKLFFRNKHELFLLIFSFISSISLILFGFILNNYIIMIFGFLMGFRVHSMQKRYQIHKQLKDLNVNYVTTYNSLRYSDFLKIKGILVENTPSLKKYINLLSEDQIDDIIANQVNNVLDVPIKIDASSFFKFIILITWILLLVSPFLLFVSLDLEWYFSLV